MMIYIDLGAAELTVENVWPDGNAPENPTADDVLAVMKSCGYKNTVVSDWALLDTIEITVYGEPVTKATW